ncbi:MAG: SUF system NifU family Fe-S cluster assembly protein [Candidatus Woesearchaeota archaeon]
MSIYQENILDHYKNPRNKGKLKDTNAKHRELNPLCGDEVEFGLKINNKEIEKVSFDGHGCAICMATASMLAEYVDKKNISDALSITKEDVFKMLSVPLSAPRVKCALLPLEVLQKAISNYVVKNVRSKTIASIH